MYPDEFAPDGPAREAATIAFIDLAGFSAISDVYGDLSAVAMLEIFEGFVADAIQGHVPPTKWIGDEVMLSFPEPGPALCVLGRLLTLCREERRLPLTRAAINHGPVIRRGGDVFGSTVNVAARVAAMAAPGQLLATKAVADGAMSEGIAVRSLGARRIRSIPDEVELFEIQLAQAVDTAWIDPVCKMHAPFALYQRAAPTVPWFCSPRCEAAYARSPETYPWALSLTRGEPGATVAET